MLMSLWYMTVNIKIECPVIVKVISHLPIPFLYLLFVFSMISFQPFLLCHILIFFFPI